MRFRNTGAAALAALGLALAACTAQPTPTPASSIPTIAVPTATPAPPAATYEVQRGEVVDMLLLRGRVAPAVDQDVFFTEQGYIRELHVERDQAVGAGELLAELDSGELAEQLTRAQADLRALEGMAASTRQQRSYSVQSARLSLQSAQDNLARLQSPPSPSALQAAQAAIERARITLQNTRDNTSAAKTAAGLEVERAANVVRNRQDEYSRAVWENGNLPAEQLSPEQRARQDQAARALADAESAMRQAEVNYDLAVQNERNAVALAERDVAEAERALEELGAPPDPFALREAERAVQMARVSLNQALANSESPEMGTRIEQARQQVAELQAKIEAGKIYAPFAGVVAEVGVKPGDLVEAYAPVINVIDPARLTLVVAEIGSAELARIGVGQELEIAFERYPGEVVGGSVEQLPSDQVSAGSLVRANRLLRIGFAAEGRDLSVGDPAVVTIVFRREPSALWLPPEALYRFDQRTFVLVPDGGGQRAVDVTTGISSPERIEIRSGLREGDTVVVTEDGAP